MPNKGLPVRRWKKKSATHTVSKNKTDNASIDTSATMKTLLESLGYDVETAGSVEQALAAIERADFDLLISDLGLPDRTGIDLMRELRSRKKLLRGIALSGYGREENVNRSLEAGFCEHFTKPVDFETLMGKVKTLLDNNGVLSG
jgi:DNA-binding response OmpR family regulator